MISDLSLIDQVWMFSLIFALIVMSLAILVLMGPAFVRDVRDLFTRAGDDDGPGPTDPAFTDQRSPAFRSLRAEMLARDADIQELR